MEIKYKQVSQNVQLFKEAIAPTYWGKMAPYLGQEVYPG